MPEIAKVVEIVSPLLKKFLTHLSTDPMATIVSGIIVFVFCEYVKEVWLMPLQEYKKLKSKTSRLLIMYAQYYGNPLKATDKNPEYDAAAKDIRLLAAELAAFAEIIPLIHLGIPNSNIIKDASRNLIGISNSFYYSSETDYDVSFTLDARKNISLLLKLRGISR